MPKYLKLESLIRCSELKQFTISEVYVLCIDSNFPISYSSLSTMVHILCEKGFLSRIGFTQGRRIFERNIGVLI